MYSWPFSSQHEESWFYPCSSSKWTNPCLTLTGNREQSRRERPFSFFGQLSFKSRKFWRNSISVQIMKEKDFVRKSSLDLCGAEMSLRKKILLILFCLLHWIGKIRLNMFCVIFFKHLFCSRLLEEMANVRPPSFSIEELNTYCQKHNLVLKYYELSKKGPAHNLK